MQKKVKLTIYLLDETCSPGKKAHSGKLLKTFTCKVNNFRVFLYVNKICQAYQKVSDRGRPGNDTI